MPGLAEQPISQGSRRFPLRFLRGQRAASTSSCSPRNDDAVNDREDRASWTVTAGYAVCVLVVVVHKDEPSPSSEQEAQSSDRSVDRGSPQYLQRFERASIRS